MTPSSSKPQNGATDIAVEAVRTMESAARRELLARATDRLATGGLVVVPTESAYVLAGAAQSSTAVAKLRAASHAARGPVRAPVWLAPNVDGERGVERELAADGRGVGPFTATRHRRVMRRLAPGPAVFVVETPATEVAAILHELALPTDAADADHQIAFRVSGHPLAAALAARLETPLLSAELSAGHGEAQTAEDAARALGALSLGHAVVLDDGPAKFRAGTTVVRLAADGGHEVLREGAYEARFIGKQTQRTVLFVCTGNTCRSPMAEAIARALGGRNLETSGEAMRFESAGIVASMGAPMTSEAAQALREQGIAAGAHASRPLTRKMIAEADVVFAMTRSHAAAVLELDPGAADKVQTLDPSGRDIPDPIGQGPEVYTETAKRLVELISRRLKELQP